MKKLFITYVHYGLYLLLLAQLIGLSQLAGFSTNILRNAFAPEVALEESLSRSVLEASELFKKHSVTDFAISQKDLKDSLFKFRMIEYHYPIRFHNRSSVVVTQVASVLASNIDEEFERCTLLERKKYLAMVKCEYKAYGFLPR